MKVDRSNLQNTKVQTFGVARNIDFGQGPEFHPIHQEFCTYTTAQSHCDKMNKDRIEYPNCYADPESEYFVVLKTTVVSYKRVTGDKNDEESSADS